MLLLPTILYAQDSKNESTILYVKLKGDQNQVFGPWARSYLEDKDEPAKMLRPKFYMHLIQRRVHNLSTERFFPRPFPDILEIELQAGHNVEDAIKKLKQHPLVEYIEIDEYVGDLYTPNDTRSGEQFSINIHNLNQAWDISQGSSDVVIGIHDSGFEINHEDLMGNLYVNEIEQNGFDGVDDDNNGYIDDIHGWNFRKNSTDLSGSSHGITVAGSAAATTDNNLGVTGSGFNCTYLPVVRNRLSSLVYICEQQNVKIVNFSWGSPGSNQISYQEVIDYYTLDPDHDILFIAAAGNDLHNNVPTDYYPASYENVLSVTGVDGSKVNTKSTRGYKIDVAGANGSLSTNSNSTYSVKHGTSFASPTVAGIAGLVRSEFPELSALQVKELIRYTSDSTFYTLAGNENLKYKQGFGVVDAHRALTEKDNIHVARGSNVTFNKYNTEDVFVAPGDTIEINLDLQNLLNGNSNLRIKLTPYEPEMIAIENQITVGQILELQKASTPRPFVFKLDPSTNLHKNHYFKLEFFDDANNYYDWQNIEINLTLQQYISFNHITGYFRPDGSLGTSNGLNLSNHKITRATSLMIVADNKVVDAAYTNTVNDIRSADFRGTNTIQQITSSASDPLYPVSEYRFDYDDGNATTPIGLDITQKIFGRYATHFDKSIITEYQITNSGAGNLDSLAVGLFTDWHFSYQGNPVVFPTDSSRVFYDNETQTIFLFHVNQGLFGGVRMLNTNETVHLQCMDLMDPSNSIIDISQDFTDQEKIQALTSGVGTKSLGDAIAGTNIATSFGASLANVNQNETVHVGFILSFGESFDILETQLDSAQKMAEHWLKGPSPEIAHQIANEGELVNIRTNNFDSLSLYKQEGDTKVLKGKGRLFQVLIDSIDYYYVQSQGRYIYDGDLVQLTGVAIPVLSATSPVNVCKNTNVIISPNGCASFNFYDNPLMVSPIHIGPSLTLSDLENDTTIYVTCSIDNSIDNFIEIDVLLKNTINNYLLSDSVSYIGGEVTATLQQTDDAVTWEWYHNGSSLNADDQASVNINFTKQGTHEIRLFATNEAGCTYIITKEIEVFLDDPTSSVVSLLEKSIIYPNPVKNGVVNITVPSQFDQFKFDLIHQDGTIIQTQLPFQVNGNVYTVYLPSQLSSNTYLLRGQTDGGGHTWKISIE